MIREMWNDGWLGRAVLFLFASLPVFVVLAIWQDYADDRRCQEAGGRIISKTSVGVGPSMSPGGGIAVVPNTVSFCVSSDGRILF